MKYVFENCENIEASGAEVQTKEFAIAEEAMEYAETAWDKMSDNQKRAYDAKDGVYMVFESVNEDEEAVDHLDAKRILWSAPIPYRTEKVYEAIDTGELWTETEVRQAYEEVWEVHEDYPTFEEYLENQLAMGRQRIGGLVEVED